MTDQTASESVAGLGQELKLLVDLIVEHSAPWLERVRETSPGLDDRAALRSAVEQHADGGFSCGGWCPICATVGVAKGQPPEYTTRAFEQAAAMVALLRAVLADRWHPEEGVHMPGFRPPPREAREAREEHAEQERPVPPPRSRPRGPRVQRVTVRRATAGERHP